MNKQLIAAVFATAMSFSSALAQSNPVELSDEFSDAASLQNWKSFDRAEGFPSKVKDLKIVDGKLTLQPAASGWYGDYQAPFLFKTVSGNFDVRARIKVSGNASEMPAADWSLAGLMVRQPKRTTQENWQPRQENWLFITTGIAHQLNLPVIEIKSTNNSLSNLKLRPAKTGWLELRIVRIDAAFILMSRFENEAWQIQDRFYRPLLQGPLQVGINAYSGWEGIPGDLKSNPKLFNETVANSAADLRIEVDYIRFKQAVNLTALPQYNKSYANTLYYSLGNLLTDFSVSNQEVLKLLGD